MACRKILCDECATTFDGINYCRPCLESRAAGKRARAAWLPALLLLGLIAGAGFLHARLLVAMGVLVASLF
jgi:hypothetical protein